MVGSGPAPGSLPGHARRRRSRTVRQGRQPLQAARLRVPLRGDLRRLPLHVRLRARRRAHAPQRQGGLVAVDGAGARRHRRPRRLDPEPAGGVGGLGPPRQLHRSRWSTAATCKERFRLDKLDDPGTCPSCGAKDSFTEARQFNLMFKTHAGPVEGAGHEVVPAARDGAGHVPQLRERAGDHRARSRRSASPRSASRSATRSRPATSSSAPASSSRWRWSSSCRRRTARGGTSTGARRGTTGTSTSAWTRTQLRLRPHDPDELSHYSSATSDVEFLFPWGWDELEGIANRSRLRPHPARHALRRAARVLRPDHRTSATCPT